MLKISYSYRAVSVETKTWKEVSRRVIICTIYHDGAFVISVEV